VAIVERIRAGGWRDEYHGVFHAAGSGWTSWYGLARASFAAASRHGLAFPEVQPITTAEYPLPARRPPDSRLDCSKLQAVFGQRLPDWRIAVTRTVDAAFAARRNSAAL
jgi:dTDP-4-dehydrorhamnose reductase